MKLRLHIVSIYFFLAILPVSLAGQGVIIPSGIYMNLSQGTMALQGNWVNNGIFADNSGTLVIKGVTNVSGLSVNIFGNVTIETGATLSINPQNSVTVNYALTNNSGTSGLILKSDATGTASLIHNSYNVPATVDRYISGDAEAWHFLSSPVSLQSISGSWLPSGTYGNGTGYDLYLWNEPNNCWIYQLNITSTITWESVHPEANFVVGRGYLYSVQATNPTKEFAGNLNNGQFGYGLTSASDSANLKGFNLVGNPYPSSIDWQAPSGWERSLLVESGGGYDMWIWNPEASNYGVFNSFTGIGTNSVTRYIASMQGYFVRAASAGTLISDNVVRVHDNTVGWKSATIYPEMVSLVVQSVANNSYDEALLLFGYTANQPGATKLFSTVVTAPSLYLPSESENCSVRYLTNTTDNKTVPVMFKAGTDGNYILSCNFNDEKFKTVMLEDRKTHSTQNMKSDKTYQFKASSTDDAQRFMLNFTDINITGNKIPASVYVADNRLLIDLTSVNNETEVFVYDQTGRIILHQKLKGEIEHSLNLYAVPQILIVYLRNPIGNLCQKLFWAGN